MDLSKLTAKELDDLAKQAQSLAAQKRAQEKTDLRDKVIGIIKDAGFSVDEIFPSSGSASAKPSKQKSTPEVKYRDPQNPKNTWSGRGRKARWLVDAEASGRPLSDFEV